MSLEVRAEDINLRVISVEMVLKAFRVDEITQEYKGRKIEKMSKVWVLGHLHV